MMGFSFQRFPSWSSTSILPHPMWQIYSIIQYPAGDWISDLVPDTNFIQFRTKSWSVGSHLAAERHWFLWVQPGKATYLAGPIGDIIHESYSRRWLKRSRWAGGVAGVKSPGLEKTKIQLYQGLVNVPAGGDFVHHLQNLQIFVGDCIPHRVMFDLDIYQALYYFIFVKNEEKYNFISFTMIGIISFKWILLI